MTPSLILTSRWRLDTAPEAIWLLLTDLEHWPRWWRHVHAARVVVRGAASPCGDVAQITWASALLCRVRLRMTTVLAERPQLLEAHAEGDLRGVGTWLIEPVGDGADVTYRWSVRLDRRWMRALSALLRPLFEWNHFLVMRSGARGMAAALDCRLSQMQEWSGARRGR